MMMNWKTTEMEEAANGRVQAEELLENESAILAQDSSSAVVD